MNKQGSEYVKVNEGLDSWMIDYDLHVAAWGSENDKEWARKRGIIMKDLGLDSIYSYLEDQGYIIDYDQSSDEYLKFKRSD